MINSHEDKSKFVGLNFNQNVAYRGLYKDNFQGTFFPARSYASSRRNHQHMVSLTPNLDKVSLIISWLIVLIAAKGSWKINEVILSLSFSSKRAFKRSTKVRSVPSADQQLLEMKIGN